MEEGSKYFDKETGVLQAPMVITVADQVRTESSRTRWVGKDEGDVKQEILYSKLNIYSCYIPEYHFLKFPYNIWKFQKL